MKPETFIGKTLAELAEQTSMFWKPIHVFALDGEDDDTGKRLIDAYSIRQVVTAIPAVATATVAFANDYYGETILRVRV